MCELTPTVAPFGKPSDLLDLLGLKVKPTTLFTGMHPFGKVRLRANGCSPAPSLSTISIDACVDEGEGRPGKVPHESLPWPRLGLLDFAALSAPAPRFREVDASLWCSVLPRKYH